MECDKKVAAQMKEMAERKLLEKDTSAARSYLQRATALFPDLQGLSELKQVLDVYTAYNSERISGEVNWYAVLGVDPSSDDEEIRKQYKKMALALHPDKNNATGAEEAFKILSQAWSLLSDKAYRLAYDEKLNLGASSIGARTTAVERAGENPRNSRASAKKPEFIWTFCSGCGTYFKYDRVYVHMDLKCEKCKMHFFAVEIPEPSITAQVSSQFSAQWPHQHHHYVACSAPRQKFDGNPPSTTAASSRTAPNNVPSEFRWNFPPAPKMATMDSSSGVTIQPGSSPNLIHPTPEINQSSSLSGPAAGVGSTSAAPSSWPFQRSTSVVQQVRDDLKTKFEEFVKRDLTNEVARKDASSSSGNQRKKRRVVREPKKFVAPNKRDSESGSSQQGNFSFGSREPRNTMVLGSDQSESSEKKKVENLAATGHAEESSANQTSSKKAKKINTPATKKPKTDPSDTDYVTMAVPDPDFYDFDQHRTESSFSENQVWAMYDDDDGMPRFYARIRSVISQNPFKLKISMLSSKSNSELGPMNWVASGFTKTCGDFRNGKQELTSTLSSFSHIVRSRKGFRGVIQVFPQKGEIWALFKNWTPSWNKFTPEEEIHKYSIVEVVEEGHDDDDEQLRFSVAPLVKVAGFKSVFRRHEDQSKVMRVTREELFKFSHQVPFYLLTGEESENVQEGFFELDTAAMPLELLQVFQEDQV